MDHRLFAVHENVIVLLTAHCSEGLLRVHSSALVWHNRHKAVDPCWSVQKDPLFPLLQEIGFLLRMVSIWTAPVCLRKTMQHMNLLIMLGDNPTVLISQLFGVKSQIAQLAARRDRGQSVLCAATDLDRDPDELAEQAAKGNHHYVEQYLARTRPLKSLSQCLSQDCGPATATFVA